MGTCCSSGTLQGYVSLHRVVFPWSLILHSQLTRLKIAYLNEDIYSPDNLSQFIDLLVYFPVLEILALDFFLPSQLAEFPYCRTICLPRLSRLPSSAVPPSYRTMANLAFHTGTSKPTILGHG
jgi:hypothetical protein